MSRGPTVFCVIPVHNRKDVTRRCLEYLDGQDYPYVQVVIVDDGSIDGTKEMLARRAGPRLTVLRGDGNLWWGGAMRLGMKHVLSAADDPDYLLMLNDDVRLGPDYLSRMVACSRAHGRAAVGSVQRDDETGEIISCGYRIDFVSMRITPLRTVEGDAPIHASAGRGVLIPVECIKNAGLVNSFLFAHYLGDIEYTSRLVERGYKLLIGADCPVYTSSRSSDAAVRNKGWLHRYFSSRSADNIVHRLVFFSVRGPLIWRLLSVPRFLIFSLGRLFKVY